MPTDVSAAPAGAPCAAAAAAGPGWIAHMRGGSGRLGAAPLIPALALAVTLLWAWSARPDSSQPGAQEQHLQIKPGLSTDWQPARLRVGAKQPGA